MRLRALYLLLAAMGGARGRPCLEEGVEPGEGRGSAPSQRAQSSCALLLVRPGESGADGASRGLVGESSEDSERVRWKRGSVLRSISVADMRKLVSERLPLRSRRALKLSLLVADFRRLRWMEPAGRGSDDARPGDMPVGVTGGDGECPRDRSSSDSFRPRTFLLDLRGGRMGVCEWPLR